MTEGGGTCVLLAHERPDKLHTVGVPAPGHDIRIIDEQGTRIAAPARSARSWATPAPMMTGYHRRPRDDVRRRMVRRRGPALHPHRRHRPLRRGRLPDPDGPPQGHDHLGRLQHLPERPRGGAARASRGGGGRRRRRARRAAWGETPVAFVVPAGRPVDAEALRAWANARLGKLQRLQPSRWSTSLPRSPIGKVLKRELRAAYERAGANVAPAGAAT